jgi:hypothetical protein
LADTATTLTEEIIEAHGCRILWDTLRIPTRRRVRRVFFDRRLSAPLLVTIEIHDVRLQRSGFKGQEPG